MLKSIVKWTLLPAAAAVLVACGGGGGSAQQASSLTFSGVVAVGAALSGAKVDVYQATGDLVQSVTASEDGSYTINIPSTVQMPLVFKAVKDETVLFSPVSSASITRVNVTPLTNLVAAQLSSTGNPDQLIDQIKSGAAVVDSNKVQSIVSSLNEALDPLLRNTNTSGFDPISGQFQANGSGYDQALNSLNIAINPTGQSSNIIVTVKAAVSASEDLPEIKFVSNQKPPALPASVVEAKLPPPSTDGLIEAFLGKLNACYQLPSSERVEGDDSVKAPVCKQIFYKDDSKTFENNGGKVGKNKAWASLWNQNVQGLRITSGTMLFADKNGDMLVSWRNESKDGNVSFSRVWLRPDDGQLKAYGNQYKYPFTVRPMAEARESLNTNKSYFSAGFNIDLANIIENNSPIFKKVLVTPPNGRTLEFVPQPALDYLAIANTTTSIIRLAGQFWDPELSSRNPRELSEKLVWAKNKNDQDIDWSASEIQSIPNIGTWKAEFILENNPDNKPNPVQYSVVTSRPLTVEEVRNRSFSKLLEPVKTEIKSVSNQTGFLPLEDGEKIEAVGPNNSDVWMVPDQALKPTYLAVQGYYNDNSTYPRWNDGISISMNQRKVTIPCTSQGNSDLHCSKSVENGYSERSRMDMIQLFAYDVNEMQWLSFFTIYKTNFKN